MQILLKLTYFGRSIIKATNLWRDNYLILREFRYFPWLAIIALVAIIVGALLEGVTVGVIASFLQGLTNTSEPPIETGLRWLDVHVLATEASPTERVYRLSILILLVVWSRSCLTYIGNFYSKLCEFNLLTRIRQRIFEQLKNISLSYYSQTRSGELINTITSEVNGLKQAFSTFSALITRGSTLIAYVISMFWVSWQLSLAAIMLFALLSVALSNLIARVREASFAVPKANGKIISVAMEFINGIRTVKAFATQDVESERFEKANQEWIEANVKVASIASGVKPLGEAGAITILIVMVITAFHLLINQGILRATSLLTFMFILFRMMPLVSQVNQAREKLSSFQGSIHNIKQILRTDDKTYLTNGHRKFYGLQHRIDFVCVDFSYELGNPVLRNITLSIEKGKTTALVGGSGAGKTTLADLIPRFYDPTRGQILLDGIDLREFEINSLRRQIAVVSQDTFIFNNTIEYNIAYGSHNPSQQEIIRAAKLANAWEFIQDLPEGLETGLGDRGVKLSGGQRQRIAIARALLEDPEILILDEATSALDSVTERLIQESLEKLSVGRTVIAIAHRLSTIVKADKVVVLEGGRVVEQGNYQELLAQQGKLWHYHQMQYQLKSTS
ncbi:MAG: ABC transporter ATP-binding protein [Xenococcaceae cyanobacterium MO_167.B27]|nr:ABC transporter ATP-binding protein [Xenococcaceae cyanobacterium MO_167.B27]